MALGFSPLDDERGREGGSYSPVVPASIVRLGTWLPFERLPVSADGAMVPLVHQAWAEVKTLASGTVGPRPGPAAPPP